MNTYSESLWRQVVYCAVPAYHENAFFEGYSPMVGVLIFVQARRALNACYDANHTGPLNARQSHLDPRVGPHLNWPGLDCTELN